MQDHEARVLVIDLGFSLVLEKDRSYWACLLLG